MRGEGVDGGSEVGGVRRACYVVVCGRVGRGDWVSREEDRDDGMENDLFNRERRHGG